MHANTQPTATYLATTIDPKNYSAIADVALELLAWEEDDYMPVFLLMLTLAAKLQIAGHDPRKIHQTLKETGLFDAPTFH